LNNRLANQLTVMESTTGTTFSVHVQPRASRLEIVGLQGKSLKVRLTSPPVDDAANRQLEEFIAKKLGVAKSRVAVIAGSKSRYKTVCVEGVSSHTVHTLLNEDP
jgi:uncharacterized protein (TIGR00251 family)